MFYINKSYSRKQSTFSISEVDSKGYYCSCRGKGAEDPLYYWYANLVVRAPVPNQQRLHVNGKSCINGYRILTWHNTAGKGIICIYIISPDVIRFQVQSG